MKKGVLVTMGVHSLSERQPKPLSYDTPYNLAGTSVTLPWIISYGWMLIYLR
jgi:hypothetical protein